jgi:hypothetical protein
MLFKKIHVLCSYGNFSPNLEGFVIYLFIYLFLFLFISVLNYILIQIIYRHFMRCVGMTISGYV